MEAGISPVECRAVSLHAGDAGISRAFSIFMPVNTTLYAGGQGVRARTGGGETGAAAATSPVNDTELVEWIKPRICQKVSHLS